ncbi:MAG: YoaK family protein [Bacteroidetes bacterium]|nr:YoaK family protein [Bacteroidota bacterium]
MTSRLPQWVEYGAFVLAFIAGSVNAVGLMGFEHQAVSHMSGITTLVGTGLLTPQFSTLLHLLTIIASFVVGAAISGLILHGTKLQLGGRYGIALYVECVLLLGAALLLLRTENAGHYLASAACGLQNAMATTYSGAVVRTTHMTGLFTDLGLMIGSRMRGEPFESRRAILYLLIIVGFLAGGTAGAWLFLMIGFHALTVAAGLCFLAAFGYRVTRRFWEGAAA